MPKANAPPPAPLRIRKAAASDLAAVEQIEREQFPNPWNREYYAAELVNSISHFFVAESPPGDAGTSGGAIVGFMLFWRLAGELELHKIAVDSRWQRQGYASRLLEFFISCGCSWKSERAVLEVRASNAPAIRLYEKYSFRLVGRRPGYYDKPEEDALLYELVFAGRGAG
jgi:[ribosomal protein S18]-alanine N-acetyltransferase